MSENSSSVMHVLSQVLQYLICQTNLTAATVSCVKDIWLIGYVYPAHSSQLPAPYAS